MLWTTLAFALYALSSSAYGSSHSAPECVTKCWEYSQYVSLSCAGATKCLCEDADFQNAVYQCLYSQCSTSKFGSALHHALGYCAGHEVDPASPTTSSAAEASPAPTAGPAPALLRNEALRRRNANMMHPASVTRTTKHHSVSASAYMTYYTARAIPTDTAYSESGDHLFGQFNAPPNAMYRLANDRFYKEEKRDSYQSDELVQDL